MKKSNNNYSDAIRSLDEFLPDTTEIDYTKVPTKELWSRIETFLKVNDLTKSMKPKDYTELKECFTFYLENIYGKKSNVLGRTKSIDDSFDQNNYTIKVAISKIKILLIKIIKKANHVHTIDDFFNIDRTEKEIQSLRDNSIFTRESIKQYLNKALFITNEKNSFSDFELNFMLSEILARFCLKNENNVVYHTSNKIGKSISNLLTRISFKVKTGAYISEDYYENNKVTGFTKEGEENIDLLTDLIYLEIQNRAKFLLEGGKTYYEDSLEKLVEFIKENKSLPTSTSPIEEEKEIYDFYKSCERIASRIKNSEELTIREKMAFKVLETIGLELDAIKNTEEKLFILKLKTEDLQINRTMKK